MKANSLRHAYRDLTGPERFRLSVLTGLRGDHAEGRQLFAGCPRVEGTTLEPEFTTPMLASYRLASAFAQAAGPLLGWIVVVQTLEDTFTSEGARSVLGVPAQVFTNLLTDELLRTAVQHLRALWDAFAGVSTDRAHLDPKILMAFWTPDTARMLEPIEDLMEGLEADPDEREAHRQMLDRTWTLETSDLEER